MSDNKVSIDTKVATYEIKGNKMTLGFEDLMTVELTKK